MSIDNQHTWFNSPLGEYLQKQEKLSFDNYVGDIFGFNGIQLGFLQINLMEFSRIPYTFLSDINQGDFRCDSRQLPLASNTIDLLLMPHTLDFSEDPHQTLREAERVLVAEGHVVISGFNPLSLWGIKSMLCKNKGFPWHANFLPLIRIKDWLALLGFELIKVQMICYSPPYSSDTWIHRLKFLDQLGGKCWPMMGGVYFIVAKKRVPGMRLIKPNWPRKKIKPNFATSTSQKNKTKIEKNQ